MQLVNEAYFGKNKNLEQIDKIFDSIIKEIKNNPKAQYISINAFTKNTSHRMKQVEDIIQKEFGFSLVGIQIIQFKPYISAMTLQQFTPKKIIPTKVIRNSNGVRMVTTGM
ncbi:hypothetical protein V6O07_07620, partial [Arthrospira platensis SPKY2]